jgi:RNA polymerase sigma factor for flagellar operon FliA
MRLMTASPVQPARAPRAATDTEQLWASFGRTGDADARERLVHAYTGFARIMAAKAYAKRMYTEMEFGDYLQYAMVGLIEAIDRFDPQLGNKFETFAAPRITGAVLSGIESSSEIQQQISARRRVVAQRVDSLTAPVPGEAVEDGPKAVFARLAELAVGLAVGFALEHSGMHRDEDAEYADNSYHGVELKQLRARLKELVASLPEPQRQVVYAHYLQNQGFDEVARSLDLSRGRIAQLHRDALDRLRVLLRQQGGVDLSC